MYTLNVTMMLGGRESMAMRDIRRRAEANTVVELVCCGKAFSLSEKPRA